jgi:hypothetical protein
MLNRESKKYPIKEKYRIVLNVCNFLLSKIKKKNKKSIPTIKPSKLPI